VAGTTGNYVARIDPAGGSVEEIATPNEFATNICFGGADLQTAYVTCHGGGGTLLSGRWPAPGLRLAFNA
jgi:gluconolactonase